MSTQPKLTDSSKATSSEVAVRTRNFEAKKGIYDKPVEIYFDGTWVPSFMSCVRKDEFYRFLDMTKYGYAAGDCFWSKENVTVDTRYDERNPTIRLGVAEIRQAPATVERKPMLNAAIDPVARHALPMTGELGKLYAEAVPEQFEEDIEVFGRSQRTGKFDNNADDVDFKE